MSYDVHITKAEHWVYSEQNPITDEDYEKIADLLDMYKGLPYISSHGKITVYRADERVFGLLIQIAERIGARVQGDDGEYYDNNGIEYPDPPDYLREDPRADDAKKDEFAPESSTSALFQVDDEVMHPKYGRGVIFHVKGTGMDTEVHVAFENGRMQKKLLAAFAPLTPIKR
ncbi:hypothetical protein FHS18_001795 [Paenibacillus phyllosphaerae]|uniref:Uncharacterized protein n=1 Tax=Paenibacillus phyllosphaerae TaxID=274593 RepID=A0A7W5AW34_9BACL|nr:hypothetical protein [Paenibacillus phyllosphaerae]MBB3109732.1 hypothetical protein [Paenibacillus phyllosphaerae]